MRNTIFSMCLASSIVFIAVLPTSRPHHHVGYFHGYLSTWNTLNLNNVAIARGSYHDGLEYKKRLEHVLGRTDLGIPVLFDHNYDLPIGYFLHMAEDAVGLYVEGYIDLDSSKGAEVWHLITTGIIHSMSYGIASNRGKRTTSKGITTYTQAYLVEGSMVAVPADEYAEIKQDQEGYR